MIYDRVPNEHLGWLKQFINYITRSGYQPVMSYYDSWKQQSMFDLKCAFVWNGTLKAHQPMLSALRDNNVPVFYVECGWFPQRQYYYLDTNGINANMSLMERGLDWIEQKHLDKLQEFRQKYVGQRRWNRSNQYILCPLQLEGDTNILESSPFKRMQDFIDHTENKFKDKKVIFKTHPVKANLKYRTKLPMITKGSFMDLAQNAELVYGINSTCLLETALMGVPTTSIGGGLMMQYKDKVEQLLAALVDMQIPIDESNLDYWAKPFLEE